ncbi:MAG TPA: branched-chain amino acid ABC transporter permease, partial [Paracoccaceae bacterium]|nr:branched-chain amino acid ABC transporter permease [Paracoccaceae bacterium]
MQNLVDGILIGSILALGAIGLTMVMHMLRFANFAHAELLSIGAYSALVFDARFEGLLPALSTAIAPFSMTFALVLALVLSMALTAGSAVLIDRLVFRRVREKGDDLSMVFASFGVALIVRSLIGLAFGLHTQLYTSDIV